MAKLHIGAMLCFAIAVAFYIASWLPAGHGFAALGVGFEVLAWIIVLVNYKPSGAQSSGDAAEPGHGGSSNESKAQ